MGMIFQTGFLRFLELDWFKNRMESREKFEFRIIVVSVGHENQVRSVSSFRKGTENNNCSIAYCYM